jgi:hypothetical protein
MALLITPTAPSTLYTAHRLQVPTAYVRISRLVYDKDAKLVTLTIQAFPSEDAAKMEPRPLHFGILGIPSEITCSDPLEILANASEKAYVVAYQFAATELARLLGNTATITAAP